MESNQEKSKHAVAVFDKVAEIYQNKFMDLSLYHDTFDIFCNNIQKEHATILDVACGPGNITKYLSEKRPDFKILGIDLAPKMLELAKKNSPKSEFELMDMKEIALIDQKFDGIICGFGLPYLSKEETIQFIADCSKQLLPDGVLYLSTMENDNSKSQYKVGSTGDSIFMNYHQAEYLETAFRENSLQTISIERKDFPEQDGTFSIDLVLIAKK